MWQTSGRDLAQIWPTSGRDLAHIWRGTGRDPNKTWPGHSQDVANIRLRSGPDVANIRTRFFYIVFMSMIYFMHKNSRVLSVLILSYLTRYRFWDVQVKEAYEDKEIPTLDEVDVCLFAFLMKKILPDCPAMKMFQVRH